MRDPIKRAAELLRQEATCLRESHTVPPEHEDWTDDLAAKAEYEELMSVAAELESSSETSTLKLLERVRDDLALRATMAKDTVALSGGLWAELCDHLGRHRG